MCIRDSLQRVIRSTSHYHDGIVQFASETQMIFTVNNLSPHDEDFKKIRSAVERVVNTDNFKMSSPAHWLIYSLVLRQLKTRVERYDVCYEIAQECGIIDEEKFKEALHFIHTKMGLIRYFPYDDLNRFVIIDPQILFDKVTELIVETFTFENVSKHKVLDTFKRKGIFSLTDFMQISNRIGQNLTPALFAKILELSLIHI